MTIWEAADSNTTITLGQRFIKESPTTKCVALVGDLGAGKTHFTKGILMELGFEGEVTSPTFGLVNEYILPQRRVCHFDFYRLEKSEELHNMGWEDYLDSDDLLIIEWANLFPEHIPANATIVKIEHTQEGRKITIAQP